MLTLLFEIALLVVIVLVLYRMDFLGVRLRHQVRSFADAAGLTTTVSDPAQWMTDRNLGPTKNYPKVRRVVHHPESAEFILYPALGKALSDYQDKTEALAQSLHAVQVVMTPLGVGDRALVVVHYSDPIPPKFSIDDFAMNDSAR